MIEVKPQIKTSANGRVPCRVPSYTIGIKAIFLLFCCFIAVAVIAAGAPVVVVIVVVVVVVVVAVFVVVVVVVVVFLRFYHPLRVSVHKRHL